LYLKQKKTIEVKRQSPHQRYVDVGFRMIKLPKAFGRLTDRVCGIRELDRSKRVKTSGA